MRHNYLSHNYFNVLVKEMLTDIKVFKLLVNERKVLTTEIEITESKLKSSEYWFNINKIREYQSEFLNISNPKRCDGLSNQVTWIEFGPNETKCYTDFGDSLTLG